MIFEEYRKKSDIDSEKLVRLVFGGEQKYLRFKRIVEECKEVGYTADMESPELNRVEMYGRSFKKSQLLKKIKSLDFDEGEFPDYSLVLLNTHLVGAVGILMTLYLIKMLGTEEQVKQWASKISKREWLTCYAQTELGHGSDVQSLKTIAVFDNKTKEFVIHSPDVESIKWWPGDLGLASSHGIVMARVITNGKDNGVFPLFIQLRDLKTHIALPGLEIGDIGPKLGYASKDNGFLRFHQFRAPANSLLGKFYKIDENGDFKTVGNPKIVYASMMESRTMLLGLHTQAVFRSLQIVCRYSIVRNQFKDSQGVEIPIINYQLQKAKLMKYVSRGFAMALSKNRLGSFLKKNFDMVQLGNFSYLQEAHIFLCGYKSYFTWTGVTCFSEMIRAAGGHGFSYYSGLPSTLLELFPDQILEGENSLLCLQIARHLLKSFNLAQRGEGGKIKGATKYLREIDQLLEYRIPDEGIFEPANLIRSLARVAGYFVRDTAEKMMALVGEGMDAKKAWDEKMGVRLQAIGKIHTIYTISYESYAESKLIEDAKIREVVSDVILYFLIESIEEYAVFIIQSNAILPEQIALLREKAEELIEKIDPHLLKLCEAYQLDDTLLWSAIGHSNGKPYENLYEWAKKFGQLNKLGPEGHPAILKYRM